MDEKLKMIDYLISNSKKEMELIEEYKSHREKDVYEPFRGRSPSKQIIFDNLKMMRRVSLEIENELKGMII